MNELARKVLVAELVRSMREAGSWAGRTHIQKTLYGFQTLFEPEPGLRYPYLLYMHGMYSFDLDGDLAEMEFYEALQREESPPYGARYAPGVAAEALVQHYGEPVARWRPDLEFVAQEIATKNVRELEALSTAMYVATDPGERLQKASEEERMARVRELKPHLSEAEVRHAHREFARLASAAASLNGASRK